MEEKKLTDEEYIERLEYCQHPMNCCICKYQNDCFLDNRKTVDLIHRLQNEASQWKSKAEHIEEVYNADREHFIKTTTEQKEEIERLTAEIDQRREMMKRMNCNYATELQKNAELQKKVENQKAVIVGQAKHIEKEKAENKRLYDEFVRLDDFCATKGCICCVCKKKKTCKECSRCGSLKTEKCNNFEIDISRYERAIERADKVQKQVDELKVENTELHKEHTILIAGSILKQQDIAKDTAKEIYNEIGDNDILVITTQEYGSIEVVPLERLQEIIKSKGVEVE